MPKKGPNGDIHNTECIKIGCHMYTVIRGGSPVTPGTVLRPCPESYSTPLHEAPESLMASLGKPAAARQFTGSKREGHHEDTQSFVTPTKTHSANVAQNNTLDNELIREIEKGLEYTAEHIPMDQTEGKPMPKEPKLKADVAALIPGYTLILDRPYIDPSDATMTVYRLKPFVPETIETPEDQPYTGYHYGKEDEKGVSCTCSMGS